MNVVCSISWCFECEALGIEKVLEQGWRSNHIIQWPKKKMQTQISNTNKLNKLF
jgi:LPS O-antigen subunit length determinant protein (WzzB/FepE family)